MKDLPESVQLGCVALALLALAFCVLGLFTIFALVRLAFYCRFRREFLELHKRRVARARLALAGESKNQEADAGSAPLAQEHSFSAWLQLAQDGSVSVGGQTFPPGQTFAVTGRDNNNLPRVQAVGNGAEVLITSHGQNFRARFTESEWDVQLVEGDPS